MCWFHVRLSLNKVLLLSCLLISIAHKAEQYKVIRLTSSVLSTPLPLNTCPYNHLPCIAVPLSVFLSNEKLAAAVRPKCLRVNCSRMETNVDDRSCSFAILFINPDSHWTADWYLLSRVWDKSRNCGSNQKQGAPQHKPKTQLVNPFCPELSKPSWPLALYIHLPLSAAECVGNDMEVRMREQFKTT